MLTLAVLALGAVGCGRGDDDDDGGAAAGTTAAATGGEQLSGEVLIDGSSTVAPLTTAAAELFQEEIPTSTSPIGTSGTGGGFEKFCAGETDISDASRPIEDDEEICDDAGIAYTQIQVANDALTVVVNKENDWATCLTTNQLQDLGPQAEGKVTSWKQVDPAFPDEPLTLSAPAPTRARSTTSPMRSTVKRARPRRLQRREDDNVTVQGVSGDPGALGYFGYSYYEENADTLKAVEVDGGDGCVAPTTETVQNGTYVPLARPLFVYV